jgi:hypothetical protein
VATFDCVVPNILMMSAGDALRKPLPAGRFRPICSAQIFMDTGNRNAARFGSSGACVVPGGPPALFDWRRTAEGKPEKARL